MLDAATIKRFDSALPLGFSALKELAMNMRSEGFSQAAIYHVFDSFGHHLSDAGRDPFEKAVIWTSIECIVGWCGRGTWWFDHRLPKEEIDEYRKMMGYPLSPLCFYFSGDFSRA
jgi:hypothetical protein